MCDNILEMIVFIFSLLCCIYILVLIECIRSTIHSPHYSLMSSGHKRYSLSDVLAYAQTGDLIFLSGKTFGEKCIKWALDSDFSHLALVVRTDDNLYLYEADIGQRWRTGVRLIDFKKKLERYKGWKVGVWQRLYGNPIDVQILQKSIESNISKKIDTNTFTYWTSRFPSIAKALKKDDTVYCTELVASTLQDVGVMKKDKTPYSFDPEMFLRHLVPLQDGYVYGGNNFFCF